MITIDDTLSVAPKLATGFHEAPPSVVFQIPPPTDPANRVNGLPGTVARERMRPPMLPGPRLVQADELMPASSGEIGPDADVAALFACASMASRAAIALLSPMGSTVPSLPCRCSSRKVAASPG